MCAIAGLAERNQELIGAMNAELAHRGPDDKGIFVDSLVSLGHRRLSIIDLSPTGHQPMGLPQGLQLVFNGEIYNYKELKEDLVRHGGPFVSSGDTEVILRGYAKEGPAFFKKMRGMWALGLYDSQAKRLVLARDPFGIKPLYYYQRGSDFAFASELHGLMPVLRERGGTDNEIAHQLFFLYGYIPGPHTPFAEVRKLPPGAVVSYDLSTRALTELDPVLPYVEPAAPYASLGEALDDSIRAHFVSDVPVGIFYSGGIDSTLLLARARALGYDPKAFFMRIPRRLDNEYALEAAKALGVTPTVIDFREFDALDMFTEAVAHIDEPFADSSYIPTNVLAREVARTHKVVLSGEGGDELFGGYHRHGHLMPLRRGTRLVPTGWLPNRIRRGVESKINRDPFAAYLEFVRIDDGLCDRGAALRELKQKVSSQADELPLAIDQTQYLPDDLLFKIDRAMMRFGLEGRVPFLDRRFFSYARTIPARQRRGATGKEMLKALLREHLPQSLVDRPKQGFSFPLDLLATLPSGYKEDAIAQAKAHPHLVPFTARALDHVTEHPQLAYALLVWAAWRKQNHL